MFILTRRRAGTFTGTVFPKEMLAPLRIGPADGVYVTETPDVCFRLTPYSPVFAGQMAMAEEMMREDLDIPHALAK